MIRTKTKKGMESFEKLERIFWMVTISFLSILTIWSALVTFDVLPPSSLDWTGI